MVLLKDELIRATGLSEKELKAKLLEVAPPLSAQGESCVKSGGVKEGSWAYITLHYAPSDCTIRDRMLKAIK